MMSGRSLLFGRLAACAAVLLTTTTCTDDTGPIPPVAGRFALAPSFASSVAGIIEIREIRFTLAHSDESMAKDTVIQLEPGADSVVLEVTVPITLPGEVFSLVVTLMDADGTVMFTGGPVDVVPGMPGSTPPVIPVTFTYTGPGANAAGVEITTDVSEYGILSGDTLRLAAVAIDSAGEPIPGTPIAWRSLDSTSALAQADSASSTYGAVVIGGTQRGFARVVAELLTGPTDTTTVGVQPVPTAIIIESGDGQSATIGSQLPSPVIARVVAGDGMGVAALVVSYTPSEGSVLDDSIRTDSDGRITTSWNLGATAGTQSLTMTVARFPAVSMSATATALPGTVATLVISPSSATLDALGAQVQLTATAADSAGNVVTDAVVTWASESDLVATVDPAGLVTAVSEGGIDIFATAETVTVAVPLTVNQVATDLAFTVEPSDVEAGVAITPPVEVSVLDRLGSVVADATDDVTMIILDNPGGGTLSGTTTVTAVNGVAVFGDLSIDNPAAYYRLEAGATGLNIAESNTFDVTVLPRAFAWINGSGGNWSDGANWDRGAPPGLLDTAFITLDSTYLVTLDQSDTVAALFIGGSSGTQTFWTGNTGTVFGVSDTGNVGPNGVLLAYGDIYNDGGFVIEGTMELGGDLLGSAGITRVAPGGVLTLQSNLGGGIIFLAHRTLQVAGTLVWDKPVTLTLIVGGRLEIESSGVATWGWTGFGPGLDVQYTNGTEVVQNSGVFQIVGTGMVLGAPFVNEAGGVLDVQSGYTSVSGRFTHSEGAVLQGYGQLDLSGALIQAFDGDVNPGTSPGLLKIVGNLPQSTLSNINIELGGLVAGSNYDRLEVSDTATLDGTLNVALVNGFTPSPGDSFAVLTYGARSGTLAALNVPALGGTLTWDTVGTATELALVVRAPAPGPILFAGDSAGGLSTGLFAVNPDGSNLTRIHTESTLEDEYIHPRWSPDAERVVLTYRTGGYLYPNAVYLMTAVGDSATLLMNDTSAYQPRYSPNGIHVAFACGDGYVERDVCVIPDVTASLPSLNGIGNGGGKVYVTDFDQVNRKDGVDAFAWDPLNPDRIAFVRDSTDGVNPASSRIYTALYDGTGVQPLSPDVMDVGNGPLQIVGTIDWSPIGQQLAFPAVDTLGEQEIYVINRDGTGLTQLTASTGAWDDNPLWSPLGTEILFTRDVGCDFDAWMMNADGSSQRKVTAESVCDFNTDQLGYDWSPDGQEIVLTGFYTAYDGPLIYKILRTTTAATYFADRILIGRYGSTAYEVSDIQPSWRP
jgi:hypothetical protein